MKWPIWIVIFLHFSVLDTQALADCKEPRENKHMCNLSGLLKLTFPSKSDQKLKIYPQGSEVKILEDDARATIHESWVEPLKNMTNLTLSVDHFNMDDISILFTNNSNLSKISSRITKTTFTGNSVGSPKPLGSFPRKIPFENLKDFEIRHFNFNVTDTFDDYAQLDLLTVECISSQKFKLSNLEGIAGILKKLHVKSCLEDLYHQIDQKFENLLDLNISNGHLKFFGLKTILNLTLFPSLKNFQIKDAGLYYNNFSDTPSFALKKIDDVFAGETSINIELTKSDCEYLRDKTDCSEKPEFEDLGKTLLTSIQNCPGYEEKVQDCYLKYGLMILAILVSIIIVMVAIMIATFFRLKANFYTKRWFSYCPDIHQLLFQNRIRDKKPHEILLLSHRSRWCLCNNVVNDDMNESIANEIIKILKNGYPNLVKWRYQTSDDSRILTREEDGQVGKDMKAELIRLCDISKRCVIILSRNYFRLHLNEFETIASKFNSKHQRKRYFYEELFFNIILDSTPSNR